MRSVQLKLGNMQSMLENQQGGFRKLTDKHVRPVQFVAPDSSNLIQSRAPRFSPQHGTVSYINLSISCCWVLFALDVKLNSSMWVK